MRAWLALAAIAIGCQFLVPDGYMPGRFADATPFVLCTMYTHAFADRGSAPQPKLRHMASMHGAAANAMPEKTPDTAPGGAPGSEHDEHLGTDGWTHCPLGALSAGAALGFAVVAVVALPETQPIRTAFVTRAYSVYALPARARAPPRNTASRLS